MLITSYSLPLSAGKHKNNKIIGYPYDLSTDILQNSGIIRPEMFVIREDKYIY